MDMKQIDERIRELRAEESRLREEIARLMQARSHSGRGVTAEAVSVRTQYGVPCVPLVPVQFDFTGGWDEAKDSLRAALDRAYAARGIQRIGTAA